jgi:hypothetical protein
MSCTSKGTCTPESARQIVIFNELLLNLKFNSNFCYYVRSVYTLWEWECMYLLCISLFLGRPLLPIYLRSLVLATFLQVYVHPLQLHNLLILLGIKFFCKLGFLKYVIFIMRNDSLPPKYTTFITLSMWQGGPPLYFIF